jgi:two-component system, cell cycle sensor histidine kinase and response regulator CckA
MDEARTSDSLGSSTPTSSLLESMPCGLAQCRLLYDETGAAIDFLIETANASLAGLVGVDRGYLAGRRLSALAPLLPEAAAAWQDWVAQVAAVAGSGAASRFVAAMPSLGKRITVIAFGVAPGEVGFLVTDVTEDARLAAEQLDAERRHRGLLDAMQNGVWAIDAESLTTYVNPRMAQMLGYAVPEMLGKHLFEFMDDQGVRQAEANLERRRRGVADEHAFTFRRSDGGSLEALLETAPIVNADGSYTGAVASVIDLAQKRLAADLLREDEDRYRALVEMLPDAVFLIDNADGRILAANAAASRLYGYSHEQLLTMRNTDVSAEPEATRAATHSQRIDVPLRYHRKRDGTIFPVEISASRFEWQGKGVHIAAIRDVSGRQGMEQALAEAVTEAQRRRREAEALYAGSRELLAHADFPTAARALFDRCKQLLGAQGGYVALRDSEGEHNLVTYLDSGALQCSVDPTLPMPIRGLRERAYSAGRPVWDNDFAGSRWQAFLPAGHAPLESVLFAPIMADGQAQGLLGLANKPGGFDEDGARLASAFAELLSVALASNRTRAALEESEERWQFALEGAGDGVWDWNTQTDEVFYSHRWKEMLGYEDSEIGGHLEEWMRLAHPDDIGPVMTALRRHLAGETPLYSSEHRILCRDGTHKWILDRGKVVSRGPDGQPMRAIGTHTDISERKQAERALREYERAVEESHELIAVVDRDYRYILANAAYCAYMGRTREQVVGQAVADVVGKVVFEAQIRALLDRAFSGETVGVSVERFHSEAGTIRHIAGHYHPVVERGVATRVIAILRDISERVERDRERELTVELLRLLNQANGTLDLIRDVTALLQSYSGCEAVGIRLRDGDDYPYYETTGFPAQFIDAERYLCARGPEGQLLRDEVGHPVFECMCGNVLCGRFDASRLFFTAAGSFWSNCTTELLASTTEADRQARTRNRCNAEGYESVALIPLKSGGVTLGLLQLNDRRQGMFTGESIALFERLAGNLAGALARRQAETALRRSEEQFRSVWDDSPIGIERYDREGRLLDASPACLAMFGVRDASAVRGFCLFDDPNIPGEQKEALHRGHGVRYQGTFSFDTVRELGLYPTSRCGIADLDVLVTPLKDDSGEVIGYLAHIQDISERLSVEEALRDSEHHYRLLADNASDVIWTADLDGRLTYVSPSVERQSGFLASEAFGVSFADIVAPESLPQLLEVFRAPHDQWGSSRWMWDVQIAHKDRSAYWAEVTATAMRDEDGRVTGVTGASRDISERKRAEEALQRSEERFRRLAETVPVGIEEFDSEGRLTYISPALCRMLGITEEQGIGSQVWDYAVDTEAARMQVGRSLQLQPVPQPWYDRYRAADGRVIDVRLDWDYRRDGQGHVEGFVTAVSDVTHEKQLQEQLIQAQKMESIGRLAGGVAHDFNNILTAITGYAEFVLDRLEGSPQIQGDVREVLENAERASNLTRQLLAFSRKQVMEMRPVDANELLLNLGKLLHRLIGEHIELELLTDSRPTRVQADPAQIEQVLVNLAVNARDAMPAGGHLTISSKTIELAGGHEPTKAPLPPGTYVVLAVTDTGVGMSAEVLSHLFEPFFTTKEVGKGTGLGLATVYGIVKQHGGDVRVQSEPGSGTTFTVYLPALLSQAPPVVTGPGGPVAGGTETILLVEDETVVRTIVKRTLGQLGYRVLDAGDGEEALALVSELDDAPELVITDLVMPRMGGLELVQRLRASHPGLRALYISGYTEETQALAEATGAGDFYLPKPFSAHALGAKIRQAIDGRS